MIDLLREMIQELRERVAALEARLPPPAPPPAPPPEIVQPGDNGQDTVKPDDPTADDEAA